MGTTLNIHSATFLNDANAVVKELRENPKRLSDNISYAEFVKYFEKVKEITKHELVIGINFVYGWMPTIMDFKKYDEQSYTEAVNTLNKAKNGNPLGEDELTKLKELFNNSLVGTSKLLHVINPNKYAIWDSRVFRYILGKEANDNIGKVNLFLEYLQLCEELSELPEYNDIHQKIVAAVGYDMTKIRTVELVMFVKGGK